MLVYNFRYPYYIPKMYSRRQCKIIPERSLSFIERSRKKTLSPKKTTSFFTIIAKPTKYDSNVIATEIDTSTQNTVHNYMIYAECEKKSLYTIITEYIQLCLPKHSTPDCLYSR